MSDIELPGMWGGSDSLDVIDGAVHAVESQLENYADMVATERKRGDFFRDAVAAARGCPPSPVEVACQEDDMCPFISDDGYPDYAACWDEVERRQR